MQLDERSNRFDLNEFKKISDPGDQMQYAWDRLQSLGDGGSRSVFRLTPRYVLKIAYNNRGKNQNETEHAISQDSTYSDYLAKVQSHASDFSWIISELVRPLNDEKEFESFFGIPFEEFRGAIDGRDYYRWEGNPKWKVSGTNSPHRDETIGTYGHIQDLRNLIKTKKLWTPELADIGHWGKTADNRIVILDYGVDDTNWKQQTIWAEGQQNDFLENQGLSYPESEMHSGGILEACESSMRDEIKDCLREFVFEVVKKCGSKWCLYTKEKKNGKRRRLGTHDSKRDAYRQEIAIQYSKKRAK